MDTTEYHLQHLTATLHLLDSRRGDLSDEKYLSFVNAVLSPYSISFDDTPALEGFVGNLIRKFKNYKADKQEKAKLKAKTLANELPSILSALKDRHGKAGALAEGEVTISPIHALFLDGKEWVKDPGKQGDGLYKAVDTLIDRVNLPACDKYLKNIEKAQRDPATSPAVIEAGSDALLDNFFKGARQDRDGYVTLAESGQMKFVLFQGKGQTHSTLNHVSMGKVDNLPKSVKTMSLDDIGALLVVLEKGVKHLTKTQQHVDNAELTYFNAMELGEYSGEMYSNGVNKELNEAIVGGCHVVSRLTEFSGFDLPYQLYPEIIRSIVATIRVNLSNYKGT